MHSDRDFQSPGQQAAAHIPDTAPRPAPGGRSHWAPRVLLGPLLGGKTLGPSSSRVTWSPRAPSPLFLRSPPFLVMAVIVSKVSPSLFLPWPPCQGLVSFSVTKACPRSGLPGEGGAWVWQLEPLSPHGAATAPPPLGIQMGFIQQTKPPPPTQATQARGPGPHRGKGVVTGTPDKFSWPRCSSLFPTTQILVLDFLP